MMSECKYCENLSKVMRVNARGAGIEASNSRHTFADITMDEETKKFYLELDDGDGPCFEIEFCPKCGRKLAPSESGFEHHLDIPVPIGEKVYSFWTDCCNACSYQARSNKEIACSKASPCHTKKYKIGPVVLTYDNLATIVKDWGVFYFATSKEAEEAGNIRVANNIKRMRELGYAIDADGNANYILTEAEARVVNQKFEV